MRLWQLRSLHSAGAASRHGAAQEIGIVFPPWAASLSLVLSQENDFEASLMQRFLVGGEGKQKEREGKESG